jgi:hypothetical protein
MYRPKDPSSRHQHGGALPLNRGFRIGMDVMAPFGHFPAQ